MRRASNRASGRWRRRRRTGDGFEARYTRHSDKGFGRGVPVGARRET